MYVAIHFILLLFRFVLVGGDKLNSICFRFQTLHKLQRMRSRMFLYLKGFRRAQPC